MAKILYVRVVAKTGAQTFYRCALEFSREWREVEVDAATAKRLQEEQMLEVVDVRPEGYAAEQAAAAEPVALTETQRAEAIAHAIAVLDKDNPTLWTGGGLPTTVALSEITQFTVTAIERDAVWAEVGKV
jgi:hypothetical protein